MEPTALSSTTTRQHLRLKQGWARRVPTWWTAGASTWREPPTSRGPSTTTSPPRTWSPAPATQRCWPGLLTSPASFSRKRMISWRAYQEVDWGLRLEQTLRMTPTETSSKSRPEQIDWCNEYNSLIREKVGPRYEDTQYYGITFMTTINLIENVLLQTWPDVFCLHSCYIFCRLYNFSSNYKSF